MTELILHSNRRRPEEREIEYVTKKISNGRKLRYTDLSIHEEIPSLSL